MISGYNGFRFVSGMFNKKRVCRTNRQRQRQQHTLEIEVAAGPDDAAGQDGDQEHDDQNGELLQRPSLAIGASYPDSISLLQLEQVVGESSNRPNRLNYLAPA